MLHQREVGFPQQVRDVVAVAAEKVVEADHGMAFRQQAFAQVRTDESGTAGNEYLAHCL